MNPNPANSFIFAAFFLAIWVAAGGAVSQTKQLQLEPSGGGTTILEVAPKEIAPQPALRRVPGKRQLNISPAVQQTLQATWQSKLGFSCNPDFCVCKGDTDCNDMFSTDACGGRAICVDSYCFCDRSAQRLAPVAPNTPTFRQPKLVPKQLTAQSAEVKASPGFVWESVTDNRVSARRIGGGGGLGVTMECGCSKSGDCEVSSTGDIAVCSKSSGAPCLGTCEWTSKDLGSAPSPGVVK